MVIMKILHPKPGQSIDLFRLLSQEDDYQLSDAESTSKFIAKLEEEFEKAKSSPIRLHGFRIQAMFEYVAASLGNCTIIKTEDSGSLHTKNQDIRVPDFRILLNDGKDFLVEVKNFYQRTPFQKFYVKKRYLDELSHYASLFKVEIRLAVYWSKWNLWTLISFDNIQCEGDKCYLTLEEALKHNEMALLGDSIIATIPPLKFRVLTDPTHPRAVSENGEVIFQIGGVELYCKSNLLTVPREQSIALFLMLYGEWPSGDIEANIENSELISIDFVCEPLELIPDQDFQMIGNMSSMISNRFNSLTAPEGTIEKLSPITDISNLGIDIPADYKGEHLPIWRVIMQSE